MREIQKGGGRTHRERGGVGSDTEVGESGSRREERGVRERECVYGAASVFFAQGEAT